MNNKKPICILFAGPVGCSKTPVAYYLSWNLGLPIFNNDAIRTEVHEDTLLTNLNQDLFEERRDARLKKLINSKSSFILDASIDRIWPELKKLLQERGYQYFIISYNINVNLLEELYKAKEYESSREQIEKWHTDHQNFLREYGQEVAFTIDNEIFSQRLKKSLEKAKKFIES